MSGSPQDDRPSPDDRPASSGDAPEELTGQGLAGMWSAKRTRGRRAQAKDADPPPDRDEPGPDGPRP